MEVGEGLKEEIAGERGPWAASRAPPRSAEHFVVFSSDSTARGTMVYPR